MIGTIHESGALILRNAVGKATDDTNGRTYEMTTTMGLAPLIKSEKTGKTWAISWGDLIDLAVEAGVDNE